MDISFYPDSKPTILVDLKPMPQIFLKKLNSDDALRIPPVGVLIGQPGTGKMTLLNQLCETNFPRDLGLHSQTRNLFKNLNSCGEGSFELIDLPGKKILEDPEKHDLLLKKSLEISGVNTIFIIVKFDRCPMQILKSFLSVREAVAGYEKKIVIMVSHWDMSPNPSRDFHDIVRLLGDHCQNMIFYSKKNNPREIANAMYGWLSKMPREKLKIQTAKIPTEKARIPNEEFLRLQDFLKDGANIKCEKIEEIQKMGIQELASLANQIGEPRLLLPRTEEEITEIQKLIETWGRTVNKTSELFQEIEKLRESDQPTEGLRELVEKLTMINQSLVKTDSLMMKLCANCRHFPLRDGDSLLLIYDSREKKKRDSLKGILMHDSHPILLDSSSFPRELADVSSSEHFTGLLRNAHIQMRINRNDLTRSTFSIIQGSPGGAPIPWKEFFDKFFKLHIVISQAAQVLKKLGLNISGGQLKSVLGGGFLGGGAVALALGIPFAGPVVAMAVGASLLFRDSKSPTLEELEELYQVIAQIYVEVEKAWEAFWKICR